MLTSTLQAPFALSVQDAAFYQEHGWVTTPTVLDNALIDEALAGLDQHWTGHRDRVLPGAGKHFADWMPGDGEGTRNNEYLSLQNRKVSRLAWSPTVGSIAAAAAGTYRDDDDCSHARRPRPDRDHRLLRPLRTVARARDPS